MPKRLVISVSVHMGRYLWAARFRTAGQLPPMRAPRAVALLSSLAPQVSRAGFGPLLGPFPPARQALAADRLDEGVDVIATIVVRDLVSRLDVPDRADLDHVLHDIDFGVRPAGMVDVARPVAAAGAVDGPALVDLEQVTGIKAFGS